jgi:gamma-glutamyl phosphate reductase
MNMRVSLLSGLAITALSFTPLLASAPDSPKARAAESAERMQHMMSMMQETLAKAGDRVASLKSELKITDAQTPAWNAFADALLAAAKSMAEGMNAMQKKMMESGTAASLPDKLEFQAKMAAAHVASLQAIKTALDPLYASFSDEQKKLADGLKIGAMGLI